MRQHLRLSYHFLIYLLFAQVFTGGLSQSFPTTTIALASVTQTIKLYLPSMLIHMYPPIEEIDPPLCRYDKIYGSDEYAVFFKWDKYTLSDPNNPWRIAASQGLFDWENADTKFNFYEHPFGGPIKVINTSASIRGITACSCLPDPYFEVSYNLYWDVVDGYTDNMRRGIAAHEIGHSQFIGHIPNDKGWEGLMLKVASLEFYDGHFSPMVIDLLLLNQIYP